MTDNDKLPQVFDILTHQLHAGRTDSIFPPAFAHSRISNLTIIGSRRVVLSRDL
jgi:hypothetical protein